MVMCPDAYAYFTYHPNCKECPHLGDDCDGDFEEEEPINWKNKLKGTKISKT